jgi:hypothetical protein
MSDHFQLGTEVRAFLRGLLDVAETGPSAQTPGSRYDQWGIKIDAGELEPIYGARTIKPFTATPGGIDNLSMSSTHVFFVPGKGELTIALSGYFQVVRANPTTYDWATADFFVNMTDLRLSGKHEELGPAYVTLNEDFVSAGQVFAAGAADAPAASRIAVAARFRLPELGMELFNKEPILLMNRAIKSVPPLEDPNGSAHIYMLPLFDTARPNDRPVAYLRSLKYKVGNYITWEEANGLRGTIPG